LPAEDEDCTTTASGFSNSSTQTESARTTSHGEDREATTASAEPLTQDHWWILKRRGGL